jgi:hypothetical protein
MPLRFSPASVAGPPSPEKEKPRFPATVVITPDGEILRTREWSTK